VSTHAAVDGIRFVKGHGTQNDFILLPDRDGALELTTSRVQALCDRHRGLGADGVVRVAPTAASPEVDAQAQLAPWFMDYRNADGSKAEMCGNGARVLARFLRDEGWVSSDEFAIATRGGTRQVWIDGELTSVEMGVAQPITPDEQLAVSVDRRTWPAIGVRLPNPHAVVFVDSLDDAGSLANAPTVKPGETFPEGVNVEFVRVTDSQHVALRVFERGVGETRSCGTGACAAVWAHRQRGSAADLPAGVPTKVDVPGGQLLVHQLPDGRWVLAGPTEMVAAGVMSDRWWKDQA